MQTLEQGKHIVMDRYSYFGIAYAQPEIKTQWAKYPEHQLPEPDCMEIDASAARRREGWGEEGSKLMTHKTELEKDSSNSSHRSNGRVLMLTAKLTVFATR